MKILVVEDSEKLRQSMHKGLTKLHYVVDSACDGNEALLYIRSYSYDVIVLDILLPKIDGFEVLTAIRDSRLDTGVILLSALSQVTNRIKGLSLGADDYLCKPFSFEELCARIQSVALRNSRTKRTSMTFGRVAIDLAMRNLTIDGNIINLTVAEFSILERLLLKPNRVVVFEEFIEMLSAADKYVSKNSLEVNIHNIRKKMKKIGENNFIETKRGVGYFIRDAKEQVTN